MPSPTRATSASASPEKPAATGFGCARADAKARGRALEAIAKLAARDSGTAPAAAWRDILGGGDAESSLDLISNPDFFRLIEERQDFWRPLVQHHPFAALIPGRTAKERQAFLARLK